MTAAALGATLTLDTLDGAAGDRRQGRHPVRRPTTLRGLGVTHLRGTGRGDLVVHILVQTPTRLDGEQEELLRRARRAARRGAARGPGRPPGDGSLFGKLRDAFKAR